MARYIAIILYGKRQKYQFLTTNLDPSIGIILPVMNLYTVGKKLPGKVDELTMANGDSEHTYH